MRVAAVACLLLVGCGGSAAPAATPEEAAARAMRFLFQAQDGDGGFRSEVHGVLQPGCSLAATVLLAAALLPEHRRAPHREGIARAFAFLAGRTDERGGIGLDGPVVDYPVYTSAHYLHALVLLRPDGWLERSRVQIAHLRSVQLHEAQGWTPADPAYGAFGFGARAEPKPLGAGLIDVSLTLSALEAARALGLPADDTLVARSLRYIERCQRFPGADDPDGDGGFFFTPEPAFRASKAGTDVDAAGTGRPRSYGTATCDGIRALLACGLEPGAARVTAARAWLDLYLSFDRVPGLPRDTAPPLEPALRYYWWATLARSLGALQQPGDWRDRLFAAMVPHQRADGSFKGFSGLMKEDDPLVATSLGLLALGALLPR